jgi:rhodanese-related sulfurtransferase
LVSDEQVELISAEEAWRLVEEGADPVFIDTRNARHWARSEVKIPGALRIWREELEARIEEVPRGRTIITYCT